MPKIRSLISVKFSCYDWASCPLVPIVESFSREVVMFPFAKDIIGDVVEVVTTVFVTVIVVVMGGEGVHRVIVRHSPLDIRMGDL